MSYLVIVESPAKARTLEKYLGKGYKVKASVGHVKDLPKSKLGVDIKNDFEPEYKVLKDKKKILSEIKKAAEKAEKVFLAPDPDREGEAIAWHIYEELKKTNKHIFRVSFNQITKQAVVKAFEEPKDLDKDRYNAQQTRRILDRLVGYLISPVLWDKVRRGLSAGRVQSVALRLIVEREKEIKEFKHEEYWNITALFKKNSQEFEARLLKIEDKKAEIKNEKEVKKILKDLEGNTFLINKIENKERKKKPLPPHITSTLQQDGYNRYKFSAKRTMALAQKLYEGIDLGDFGTHGLITYMRTDSTRAAPEALSAVRNHVQDKYGKDFCPTEPHVYKAKKGAQEAHECIRPTTFEFEPEKIKKYLSAEEFKLYGLIWNRFVASQMSEAIFDQTSIDIMNSSHLFRATGSILKFEGFLKVFGDREDTATLPLLQEKEKLEAQKINPSQHFTQPPPKFNEGSLVKELESNGIGRPSTYAAIISNILAKKYVEKEEGRLFPTELGILISDLLVKSFPDLFNVEFTARMEGVLDEIEEGKADWRKTLHEFYGPFEEKVQKAKKEMKNVKGEETPTDHKCPKCQGTMVIKWGRHGKFLACSNYPECKSTTDFQEVGGKIKLVKEEMTDEKCEKCGNPMLVKRGRFGKFLACSKYPECKSTKSISIGIACPLEGCNGSVIQRRSRKGRMFFGCSNYPKCTFVSWNKPIPEKCPDCGAPYLLEKITKKEGTTIYCHVKECSYKRAAA
ncbi:MAG: type I DNA topoisomerase [Deltaproteobacteria bacterium]|nr:type I DNA topoisomerase [Deltaproteobacteria bacterium]